VVSTWNFGMAANEVAWERLAAGGSPLDAVEAGGHVPEADPSITSVGLGGRPNADGVMELDAAVMRGDTLDVGAVAGLQGILHPVSVARAVLERTPHVLLVGEGARAFALQQGLEQGELLSDDARAAWERWRARQPPKGSPTDDHDTLGIVAFDGGRFATAVTTSGLAFKLPGRVGDSPLPGAGGYCDDEAGAAVATGNGEEMIRTCATYAVVEAMRLGHAPQEAVRLVLARVRRMMARAGRSGLVALLAVDRFGRVGAGSLVPGFQFAVRDEEGGRLLDAEVLS
jgi:isoaspartyl peptidase/L-asparaginase-like protein (Ntn-hydrolase superfamily)